MHSRPSSRRIAERDIASELGNGLEALHLILPLAAV